MRSTGIVAGWLSLAAFANAGPVQGAQCGSALLLEVSAPAVFSDVSESVPVLARYWEAGAGGANGSDAGCQAGCASATDLACAGGGACLAIAGVSWLNATCSSAGRLPLRTVFLLEQVTASAGGRWAAINLDRNSSDANTDLDAKAQLVCASCASAMSPYLGGAGVPAVTSSTPSGGALTATLSWDPPSASAQALSNAPSLVRSYSVFYRGHVGPPPPSTGDPAGWTLVADLEPDGAANGGFSTDESGAVQILVPAGIETVTFAIGLNLDGGGNPTSDPNTKASRLLSGQSAAVVAQSLLFTDGFESGDSSAWSVVVP